MCVEVMEKVWCRVRPDPTRPDSHSQAVSVKMEGEGLKMNNPLPWQPTSQTMEIRRSIVAGQYFDAACVVNSGPGLMMSRCERPAAPLPRLLSWRSGRKLAREEGKLLIPCLARRLASYWQSGCCWVALPRSHWD